MGASIAYGTAELMPSLSFALNESFQMIDLLVCVWYSMYVDVEWMFVSAVELDLLTAD